MRYLSIVDAWFDDAPGGMARVAADHARILAQSHEVTLACIGDRGPDRVDGVEVERIRLRPDLRGLRRLLNFSQALRSDLAKKRWDVIHIHSAPLGTAATAVVDGDTPVLYTVHSPVQLEMEINWRGSDVGTVLKRRFQLPALGQLERRLARRSTVHVLSRFTADYLRRAHGIGEPFVIPHWVDHPLSPSADRRLLRSSLGWPSERPILFTVRGHKPRVGLEDLIEAAAPLVASGRCEVVIAGSGPLTHRLRQQAQELGVSGGVHFPGRISDAELDAAYQAADLFVLPTRELECFGLVTIEALARGLPVVGSDAGATPEILGELDPRLLYPSGDVVALRERLDAILSGRFVPPSSDTLRSFVSDRYSPHTAGSRFVKLVERLARGSG